MQEITVWSEAPRDRMGSYDYWNDPAAEEDKVWAIRSASDTGVREYVTRQGFVADLETLWREGRFAGGPARELKILDAAAGTCWASALLSAKNEVGHVCAVDFSRHRLETFAPPTVESLGGDPARIERCYGSFYDIKKPDAFFDVVFMNSAFHHADNPLRLLVELDRVLKPGGTFLFMGETRIGPYLFARRVVKHLLYYRRLDLDFADLFPPLPKTGDHYYSRDQYKVFFRSIGRKARFFRSSSGECWNIVAR